VNKETIQNYLERLLSERARLIQRIEALEGKGEGGIKQAMKDSIGELSLYDNHPADVSSELFERGKDIKLCEDAKIILKRVDEAIDLLNSGNYGTCEHCGNDIEEDRLDLIPYTRLCSRCQGDVHTTAILDSESMYLKASLSSVYQKRKVKACLSSPLPQANPSLSQNCLG
jgi:RNA polymerase-binding transcription factor DksA